ncbi:hypothetical protein FB451DRAFT_1206639 [Mycena latifolia]|nr:hypothetical protein FB451DRAFT_1206639 [Mycena latifolia]
MPWRYPTQSMVRNVVLYPADGSEPCITSMLFSTEGAKAHPHDRYTVNIELQGLYGADKMFATRSRVWGVETLNPDEQYVLYHNISPELPVNLAMARAVGVDPKTTGRRLLWRGDVVVVKRREWPDDIKMWRNPGPHMDYVDIPPPALRLFTSRLIPEWYNSDHWLNFLQKEVNANDARLKKALFPRGPAMDAQAVFDKTSTLIQQLVIRNLRDPHNTIVRDVILFPANGDKPRITAMPFSEEGAKALPHGPIDTIDIDLRGLYGAENMFATLTKGWPVNGFDDPEDEINIAYYNFSPGLPVNLTMARLVGADPAKPGKQLMWRGDVVVVNRRKWPGPLIRRGGSHVDFGDVTSHALDLFMSHLIPEWYKETDWKKFLREQQEWSMLLQIPMISGVRQY